MINLESTFQMVSCSVSKAYLRRKEYIQVNEDGGQRPVPRGGGHTYPIRGLKAVGRPAVPTISRSFCDDDTSCLHDARSLDPALLIN